MPRIGTPGEPGAPSDGRQPASASERDEKKCSEGAEAHPAGHRNTFEPS